ncbi:MAG: PA14 domain-containing protein [Chitinophagales bacterium]
MKRLLLFVSCLFVTGSTVFAQDSYWQKAYSFVFGSCPNYSGTPFDIHKKSGNGLNATYYNGSSFDHEVVRRTDPEVYFYYNGTSPAVEVNVHQFSVVWTGYLYAPKNSEYTFTVKADDGIKLWLNGNSIIDEWHGNAAPAYTAKAKLTGGEAYEIRIEYYQANNDAKAELYWEYEGQQKRVIPQKYLLTSLEEEPEPIVLLGPSFLAPTAQKKYLPPTAPPSIPDYENVVAVAKIPKPSNPSYQKPKSKPSTTVSTPKFESSSTISTPTPKSKPQNTTTIPIGSYSSPAIVAQTNKPDLSSRMVQTTKPPLTSNNTPSSAAASTKEDIPAISGELDHKQGIAIAKASTNPNPSLLQSAIGGKKGYQPGLSKKPRRSGPVVLKNILFDKDRYRLKPSSYDELNALVDTLQKNQALNVIIAGHTDFAGQPIPNQNLSESRARAVAVYLIRHGINSMRIQTKGYGGTKPLSRAPLGTEERRKNKRVEYILIEEGAKP